MSNEISGQKHHLFLSPETAWGTTDGSPIWVPVPCFDYGVRFRPERRNAQPMIGVNQRKHGVTLKGMPSGTIQTSLYGQVDSGTEESIAETLIKWALLNPEEILNLPSMSAQWAEGPNVSNKTHTGLRVNSATLSGSDASGIISLALDVMGKSESLLVTAQSLPNDRNLLQEFQYVGSEFKLAGAAVKLSEFQYQAARNLEVNYLGSFNPELITSGPRVDNLQFTLIKNSDTYDAYRRSQAMNEFTGEIVIRGLHNGTGTAMTDFTVCTITFNRLSYADHEDQRSFETLTKSPLQLDVLKPDDGNPAVEIAWSEV